MIDIFQGWWSSVNMWQRFKRLSDISVYDHVTRWWAGNMRLVSVRSYPGSSDTWIKHSGARTLLEFSHPGHVIQPLLLLAHLLFASFTSLAWKALLGRLCGLGRHCSSSGSEHCSCLRLTLISWVPLGIGLKRSCRVGRNPESLWDTSSLLDHLHPPFEVIWGNN